jgi:outer membrane protein TolC
MRYFIISILIAGGLIFPAGCSDSQRYDYDNQYDSELIDSDYESISRDIETPEKEELPVLDANSTLKDYLSYAALNNASLKSAFQSWRAGLEQIPQAEALPDPQFTYSYYIQEVETRVGPQEHKLGIMQKFPWFGKIEARTDAAAASARVAREEYRTQKLEVFRRVKSTYAEYAYLHKAIDIARENLQLLEHFEEVARTQYRAAAATHPDVIRAQIETAKIRDTLESLEQLQPAIAAELNAALNRPSGADLPKPQPLNPVKEKIDDRELLSMVKNLNPELRAINERIIEAEQKVELARKRRYPDIGAGVSWTQTGDAVNPGVSDSGTDPVMLTFAMNLPLWTDSYSAGERQAEARVRQRRFEKTEKENVLSAKAQKTLYKFEDSRRKLELYGDILVPKTEDLLAASETAYSGGQVDFLSLIDAQRKLLSYRLKYQQSLRDNIQNYAGLEMLTGGEISSGEDN